MVLTFLILILSYSLILKRDKSILHSRAIITIFVTCCLITYGNLSFLFLAKGIGIFAGLSSMSRCSKENTREHSSYIPQPLCNLLLSTRRIASIREHYAMTQPFSNILQSSVNTFMLKLGFIYTITIYGDVSHYDSIVSFYHSITNAFSYLTYFNFGSRPMHPFIKNTHDLLIAMEHGNVNIRPVLEQYVSRIDFTAFSPLSFSDLLQFHTNLAVTHSIQRFIFFLMGPLALILGVNIHSIIEFIVTTLTLFKKFVNSLIKRCAAYYDPIRNCYTYPSEEPSTSSSRKTINNNNKVTSGNSGSEDDDPHNNKNNKEPIAKSSDQTVITLEQLLVVLEYICGQILNLRQNTNQTIGQREWYGTASSHGFTNLRVSLQHMTRYAIVHPNELVPSLNIPLSSILSSDVMARVPENVTLRTLFQRVLTGRRLADALIHNQRVRVLLEQQRISERNIVQGIFLFLLSQLQGRGPS